MSRKQKLFDKLKRKPSPLDFTWEDLVSVMNHHGFKEDCSDGSHYSFEHDSGLRLIISKPHPSNFLKRYQIKDALVAIEQVSKIGENDEQLTDI